MKKVASQDVTPTVIVTHEAIAERMAGPAIRAFEMAQALRPDVRTILATPFPAARDTGSVETRTYTFDDPASMDRAVAGASAVLVQGFTLHKFPALSALDVPIVVDLYCPFHLENLERRRLVEPDAAVRRHGAQVDQDVLLAQLRRGDFFLCASERQRDYWLGALTAAGRLTADTLDGDAAAESLLAVVPFGVPAAPPAPGPPAVKGVVPGIAPGDRLVMWGGSVTDWHDPVTPIRAVADASREIPTLRLVFPADIPNPELPPMRALERARHEADTLGLTGRHVFFIDWIPYDRRAAYLLEAEIGLSAHVSSLETRFAWRTRILDYLWATLPVVCTRGDSLADLVEQRGLGVSVAPGDAKAMARAFVRILTDDRFVAECRSNLAAARASLHWRDVVEPLRRFCLAPARLASAVAPSSPDWRTRAGAAARALGWGRRR